MDVTVLKTGNPVKNIKFESAPTVLVCIQESGLGFDPETERVLIYYNNQDPSLCASECMNFSQQALNGMVISIIKLPPPKADHLVVMGNKLGISRSEMMFLDILMEKMEEYFGVTLDIESQSDIRNLHDFVSFIKTYKQKEKI